MYISNTAIYGFGNEVASTRVLPDVPSFGYISGLTTSLIANKT